VVPGGSVLDQDIVGGVTVQTAGKTFLYTAHSGNTDISAWQIHDDGHLTAVNGLKSGLEAAPSGVTDISTVHVGGQDYVLAITDGNDALALYKVKSSGNWEQQDNIAWDDFLGFSNPRQVETLVIADHAFAIVGSFGSSGLSVFEITAQGRLVPTDFVMDAPGTRFANVSHIASTSRGDMGFVVVAGGDDGITLFQVLPNGRLLHLGTLADSLTTTLSNVSALDIAVSGDMLVVAVTSAIETGVTLIEVSLNDQGQTVMAGTSGGVTNGTAGDDVLVGAAGADLLFGGLGDDVIIDGDGSDQMTGGAGADTFVLTPDQRPDTIMDFQPGQDRLDLSGWTFLRNTGQLDIVSRSYGADISFHGETLQLRTDNGQSLSRATILGWDVLDSDRFLPAWFFDFPSSESSDLIGDAGDNELIGTDAPDLIDGGEGSDVLRGGAGTDTLRGGLGEDTLIGGLDADTLSGGEGSDVFIRGADDFTDLITDFEAGAGGDVLVIEASAYNSFAQLQFRQNGSDVALLFGPAGTVHFQNMLLSDLRSVNFRFEDAKVAGQDVTLAGDAFVAIGTTGDDTFRASRVHMESPDFLVRGGQGFDTVVVSQSSLFGDLGATGTYFGIEAFDLTAISTIGISISDALVQQSGNKRLTLRVGDEGTTIGLDAGSPTQQRKIIIDGARLVQLNGDNDHKVSVSDAVGGHVIGGNNSDTIKGGDMDDVLRGGDGKDKLNGALGNDHLMGEKGNDTLNARGGDDTLDGGPGGDLLNGGGGSDTHYIDSRNDTIFEKDIWTGIDVAFIDVDGFEMTKNAYVEVVYLMDAARSIRGNQHDTRFVGNAADNVFVGGRGADTIEGGAGADTFVFEEKLGNRHVDTIVDFDSNEGDVVHLDAGLFSALSPGGLSGVAFHLGAAATSASHRIVYDTTTGDLRYDADGSGGADAVLVATFSNTPTLQATDFVVI
jgi:Ca2+-binding RTX toxin-like protein